MSPLRCSFCGSEEDVVEQPASTSFETLSSETAMCRSCSEALQKKARETEKVYEWTDRGAATSAGASGEPSP